MSLGFALWLFIFVFLIGFWFWTNYIVLKQNRAWKFYAQKKKLRYKSNGMLETPSLSGSIDGYNISVFASEHSELDARSQRRLSAIEITMHTSLPVQCAIASGGMVPIAELLEIKKEYRPNDTNWDNSFVCRAEDPSVVGGYLTDDRLKVLIDAMKIDKAWMIAVFVTENGLLRLDTPLPLDHPKELDKVVKQLIEAAKTLELNDGEAARLMKSRSDTGKSSAKLDIDEDLLDDDMGLELEE